MPISNPKPDFHNINAHTKFGENTLTFTQIIVRKRKYGRAYDRRADGRPTDKRKGTLTTSVKTIIPRHYRVAGYKNRI